MKIVVLSFEKDSRSPFYDLITDFRRRTEPRFLVEEKYLKFREDELTSRIEILLKSYKNPFLCVLDETGRSMNTGDFSQMLLRLEQEGRTIVFLIGPHKGFEKPIKIRYDLLLSLSKMTFSHQIARLLLFEQIYRTYCYINNHPYNK